MPSLGFNGNIAEDNGEYKWKSAGSVTSTDTLNLPSNFNELFIVVRFIDGPTDEYACEQIIIKNTLSSAVKNFNLGGRLTVNNMGTGASANISTTTYKLKMLYINTTDMTSKATSYVYYR